MALDTTLTEELRDEGFVREFVHLIQNLRKEAGFEVSDRIRIRYKASDRLRDAIQKFEDHIRSETLCEDFEEGETEGELRRELSVNGEPATVSVERLTRPSA